MRFGQAIGGTAGLVLCANVVWAQQAGRHGHDDERTRYLRELVQQAQSAQAAGNHQGALDLALQVERFSVNPSILMFIAEEYQALYRPSESRDYAERCIQSVQTTRFALDDREAILQRCRELRSAGENGFGSVRVVLPEDAPTELRVFVAGRQVTREECREPRTAPVGEVEVEATAPGYLVWRQRVTVRSREASEARVQLVAVPTSAGAIPPPGTIGRGTTEVHLARSPGPWVLWGTGLVLAGVATGVGLGMLIPLKDVGDACERMNPASSTSLCPNPEANGESLDDLNGRAETLRSVTFALVGGAIMSTLIGVVWRATERTTVRVRTMRPSIGVMAWTGGGGLVSVGGTF
jgi:hypothetical protein